MNVFRDSGIFGPKKNAVAPVKFCVPVGALGLGCEKPNSVDGGNFRRFLERLPISVVDDVEIKSIVHSASAKSGVGYCETQRVYQVQARSYDGA